MKKKHSNTGSSYPSLKKLAWETYKYLLRDEKLRAQKGYAELFARAENILLDYYSNDPTDTKERSEIKDALLLFAETENRIRRSDFRVTAEVIGRLTYN